MGREGQRLIGNGLKERHDDHVPIRHQYKNIYINETKWSTWLVKWNHGTSYNQCPSKEGKAYGHEIGT